MYSVHQHWDRLKTCIVGCSYPPEFYSYITNARVRNVMERIAIETEEDYQKLISLLESFDVKIMRPHISSDFEIYKIGEKFLPPPMTPRDYGGMFSNIFFWQDDQVDLFYNDILENIKNQGNKIIYQPQYYTFDTATVTRVGKDIYFGTADNSKISQTHFTLNEKAKKSILSYSDVYLDFDLNDLHTSQIKRLQTMISQSVENLPEYRKHIVNTLGHCDSCFCPVVPGLIISLMDIQEYKKTFPGWEVVYLPNQSWGSDVWKFLKLKEKNDGKWWVPGEELNDAFTSYVEQWLNHWVGYVEETVFDVNMLVIDKKNVVCNNYNKLVFDALERYGVTPHIINFRHRYFWDGGLHCITQDLDREGELIDYFPERGFQ